MDSQVLKIIPRSRKDYLFVSMNSLMGILLGKSGMRTLYEERRKDYPGWPTYKTLVKYSSGNDSDLPSRPTSQSKLDLFASYFNERMPSEIIQEEFYWDRYPEWFGLLQGFPFNSEIARNYWLDMLAEGRVLAFSLRSRGGNIVDSIELYNHSDLVWKIGQPSSREIIKNSLSIKSVHKGSVLDDPAKAIVADQYTVVVRLMAWMAADRLLILDRDQVSAEMENDVFPDFLLPGLDGRNSSWSNPVRSFFEKLAEVSGVHKDRAIVPFLAEKWDVSEKELSDKTDLKHKERLIRMWIDDRDIVDPLPEYIESCMLSLRAKSGIYGDVSNLVDLFWLALAMRKVWYYLKYQEGIPDRLLADIFSVYGKEFHHANTVLMAG